MSERRSGAKSPKKSKKPARPAASSHPPKPAKKPVAVKAGGAATRKAPPPSAGPKSDSKSHGKSSREIATVKERASDGRGAAAAKLAAAKLKDLKDGKGKPAIEAKTKGAADVKAKDAKGKLVKGKVVVPPPPPRKIQVVQLSSLKPGARGTKAVLARRPDELDDRAQTNGAKKRRSAELTSQQILHFRELLEQRRHRLSSDLTLMQDEALKVTGQDNSADSVADAGTDNYEQDFTLGLIESEEALAREVDEALIRIERNAFGVCESCETPIPLARLEILPFTRCCVDCQQKREGRP